MPYILQSSFMTYLKLTGELLSASSSCLTWSTFACNYKSTLSMYPIE